MSWGGEAFIAEDLLDEPQAVDNSGYCPGASPTSEMQTLLFAGLVLVVWGLELDLEHPALVATVDVRSTRLLRIARYILCYTAGQTVEEVKDGRLYATLKPHNLLSGLCPLR